MMPTGDFEVPRWCVTFKNGRSNGRGGCYGRIAPHEVITTVGPQPPPAFLPLLPLCSAC